jgi:hypothetical protein
MGRLDVPLSRLRFFPGRRRQVPCALMGEPKEFTRRFAFVGFLLLHISIEDGSESP